MFRSSDFGLLLKESPLNMITPSLQHTILDKLVTIWLQFKPTISFVQQTNAKFQVKREAFDQVGTLNETNLKRFEKCQF